MTLDLVCHVVDNYGDIAVAWRLAQALVEDGGPDLRVRLLLDDWSVLADLLPELDANALAQRIAVAGGAVTVLRSTHLADLPHAETEPAEALVETFGAATPPLWLDRFRAAAAADPAGPPRRLVHLEYLTAEAWSEEYHGLPSPVGYPGVERTFFVPGFRPRSGGLVFTEAPPARTVSWRGREDLLISLFAYEHRFDTFWADLAAYLEESGLTARVLIFPGLSREGAWSSWRRSAGLPGAARIEAVLQPFADQASYTQLLRQGDFHVVRGEESWVQAVLAGRPFLWQAYLQPEGHQIVKVEAFLDVWRPWFEPEGEEGRRVFELVAEEFRRLNRRRANSDAESLGEGYAVFLRNRDLLTRVGGRWAEHLRKNAKLSRRLLDFLNGSPL